MFFLQHTHTLHSWNWILFYMWSPHQKIHLQIHPTIWLIITTFKDVYNCILVSQQSKQILDRPILSICWQNLKCLKVSWITIFFWNYLFKWFLSNDLKDTLCHCGNVQFVNIRWTRATLLEFFSKIKKGIEAFR